MSRAAGTRSVGPRSLHELEERVTPVVAQTVDALQLAALLEADGITDELARTQFGFDDVFALAAEVRHRCLPGPAMDLDSPATPAGRLTTWRRWLDSQWPVFAVRAAARTPVHDGQTGRLLSHGVIYLLPAAVFPAVVAVLGTAALIMGIAIGAVVAWVWSGAATWLAYQLLGAGRDASAGRVLRRSVALALPLAAGTGLVVAESRGVTATGPVLVAAGQMTYQMGAMLLVFYRRETVLFLAMAPAVVAGAASLLLHTHAALHASLLVGAGCAVLVLLLALLETRAPHPWLGPVTPAAFRFDARRLGLVALYTALTATFLLHAQSRYLTGSLEVSVGLLPLIAGMGVVELRAFRFPARARAVLAGTRYPREFAICIRWLLAVDLLVCGCAVALIGCALLYVLHTAGLISLAGALMALASVFLACSYYVSFLLSGLGKIGALTSATAACLVIHLAVTTYAKPLTPLEDTATFTAVALGLLLMSVTAALPWLTQPRAHA